MHPFIRLHMVVGNISVCHGCKGHYHKELEPPHDLLHEEWRTFKIQVVLYLHLSHAFGNVQTWPAYLQHVASIHTFHVTYCPEVIFVVKFGLFRRVQ